MVSLAGNIKAEADQRVQARWLKFDAVMTGNDVTQIYQTERKFVRLTMFAYSP